MKSLVIIATGLCLAVPRERARGGQTILDGGSSRKVEIEGGRRNLWLAAVGWPTNPLLDAFACNPTSLGSLRRATCRRRW
jgi:hypothetical protein